MTAFCSFYTLLILNTQIPAPHKKSQQTLTVNFLPTKHRATPPLTMTKLFSKKISLLLEPFLTCQCYIVKVTIICTVFSWY